ncbi:hypothetical protein EV143_104397 [Flavobacterium chryseum]|uniref:hypothetical protein n=1 Tax=Flavobacterium sp. P3160 TaxID=2512113 RepID=UPI00105B4CF2|nr:hypothetical protein [Flavobacterium sp. P3160]TDO77630.1 hypothetical protein EV143_104397 [Flavobacterium sp. P3160]
MATTTIEAQIYTVFDTSKKIANDTPDLLLISFDRRGQSFVCNCSKVFNNDQVPFFSLIVCTKGKLSELVSTFLLSEKIRFRFENTTDPDFMNIESNIRKVFFNDWLCNKTHNIHQRDFLQVEKALEKIK